MRTASGHAATALAACLLLTGCDPEEDAFGCGFARCDIRSASCQRRTAEALTCLRGGAEVMPEVDVIDVGEYTELTRSEPLTEDERTLAERLLRGLSLLTLAPEAPMLDEINEDFIDEIAASYLPESKRVVIIDRNMPVDDDAAVALLTHELVHAMQDEQHDLEALFDEPLNLDQLLALKALIEGEATHYEILTVAQVNRVRSSHIDWWGVYGRWQGREAADALEDESPVTFAFGRFPYAFGGELVSRAWLGTRDRGVQALYDDPPRSTREVLLAKGGRPFDAFEHEPTLEGEEVPVLGERLELLGVERLGAWLYAIMRGRLGIDGPGLRPSTFDALIDDAVSVFWDEESQQLVTAWRLRFAQERPPSEAQRSELEEAFGTARSRVFLVGTDLMILVSNQPFAQDALSAAPMWQAAPASDAKTEVAMAHIRRLLARALPRSR